MSRSAQEALLVGCEALQVGQEWSRGPPGGLGVVGTLTVGRELSGGPPGELGVVRRPSRWIWRSSRWVRRLPVAWISQEFNPLGQEW